MASTYIVVQLQVEGIHRWPDAGDYSSEVAYLEYPHRHVFHIKVTKKVTHSDRDIEIIMFKRALKQHLEDKHWNPVLHMLDFRSMSCEQIAQQLCLDHALFRCEVLEDGENGALIENSEFQ